MSYTKQDVQTKILKILKTENTSINPSVITQKLGWNKDTINEVRNLYGVAKFIDILKQIQDIQIQKDENGTAYVSLLANIKTFEKSNTATEKKMANNQNKSQKNENLHDRMEALLKVLGAGLYEKETAVRLALLTALAGESIFFLGAPGSAKSMIARRVVQAFKTENSVGGGTGVQYFETLLNQFSTPEEVFGNISLKALNGELEDENGNKKEEYRRITENMLPEADIAFLDEIWKASPAILNTLLTIVNERKFHNGSRVMDVPLKALFAASNELPAKDRGLEALYDRFILRLCVGYIQNEENFFDMIEGSSSSDFALTDEEKKLQISNEELKNWKDEIDKVTLSEAAKFVITAIRKELTARNAAMSEEDKKTGELFEVGDRRWKKIAHILKASAFLNDRAEVDLMDCQLIEYCIWSTEKQQKEAREIVEKCIKQNGLDCDTAIEDIEEQIGEFEDKVDEDWFEPVYETVKGKPITVSINNEDCYKVITDDKKEFYVGAAYYYTSEQGNNRRSVYNGSRSIDGKKITWKYKDSSYYGSYTDFSGTIQYSPDTTRKTSRLQLQKFSDIAHATLQKNFDKDHYTPIVDKIQSEIASLKAQKDKDAVPFKANLFANQEYNASITAKLDDAIHQLEDAKVNLDKQRARYFKPALAPKLSVGDVILESGSVFTAAEIENLTDEQKESVIAVVCIAGEKTYAMGIEQYRGKWSEILGFASNYGTENALPTDFASGWIVPDKNLLNTIWQNRKTINESLQASSYNIDTLTEEEYWSSTENGDSAAFYQMFDEEGEQDDTTKTHEYSVCVIREWSLS